MNASNDGNSTRQPRRSYFWIFEILVIATVVPALVVGIDALNKLPVV